LGTISFLFLKFLKDGQASLVVRTRLLNLLILRMHLPQALTCIPVYRQQKTKEMKKTPLMITKKDLELFKNHLLSGSNLSVFNKTQLSADLRDARIVEEEDLPDQVVTTNSFIKLLDVETSQEYRFYLVSPADANIKSNKVSVLAPIGMALFGYGTGATVRWEMPDGFKLYKILGVSRTQNLVPHLPAGLK
jgi:regulator of nucleoside diphosphate kinase